MMKQFLTLCFLTFATHSLYSSAPAQSSASKEQYYSEPLYKIIEQENPQKSLTEIREFLKENPMAAIESKSPLLFRAVCDAAGEHETYIEIFKTLLAAGADPDIETECGTALHMAVVIANPEITRALLDKGAKKEAQNKEGNTPLEIAIFYKSRVKSAKVLLEYGANANRTNDNGWTLLHKAVYFEDEEFAEALCDHGADVNAQNFGHTPLHIAVVSNFKLHIMQLLLNRGADLKIKDNNGRTPLDRANRDRIFNFLSSYTQSLETSPTPDQDR